MTALTVCATTALAAGCGSTAGAGNPYGLAQPGVLMTGAESDQKPFAFAGKEGATQGFAVDLINEFAHRRGLKVQYRSTDIAGLLTGIKTGRYDIGASALNPTPERSKNVGFTKPFYWGYTAVLTTRSTSADASGDFDGKKIGVTLGSVQEAYVAEHMPKAKIIRFRDATGAVSQLLSGGIDGVALGGTVAEDLIKQYSSLRIAIETSQPAGASLPLPKDSPLRSAFDSTMARMVKDGTYLKLYRKWLAKPPRKQLIGVWPDLSTQLKKGSPTASATGSAPGKP
ncbi:ABC transporter substrate-binding protein [Streptomyces sp. NPDC048637]|uniref:ABC transporter substrate-binding protein n=1 Tax=Streptomyces sp. NPDC048637 TaxID=3155636 RepID=UPI0034350D3E